MAICGTCKGTGQVGGRKCGTCNGTGVVGRSIPDLVRPPGWRGWFWDECPACGSRFWHSHWNGFFYPLHYAEIHLGIQAFRWPR